MIGRLLMGLLFMSTLCVITLAQDIRQNRGSSQISGRVLDPDGKPVCGATVCANAILPEGGTQGICVDSRPDGKFTIHRLRAGVEYTLIAAKEAEYYAFPLPNFGDASPGTRIKATPEEGQALEGVEVRLGPKAGRLTGMVSNAETNETIKRFRIMTCRDATSENCVLAGAADEKGHFSFLVPAGSIRIIISASGFEDWYGSEGPKERATAIIVGAGTATELNVFLRPASSGK